MLSWWVILIILPENKMLRTFIYTIAIAGCFGLTQTAFSQDTLPRAKNAEQTFELSALGYLNSNTINNDFVKSLYYGDIIDADMKQNAREKIAASNTFGGMSRVGFTYTYHSLSSANKPVFSFSLFDRSHLDMKFSDDLFNMLFYGNKMFAGETAQLGNFNLDFLRYQQFRFGWGWKGDATHGGYGFACSFLSGEQNITVKAPTADLFTASDGTYLNFDIAMDVDMTDTSRKEYFAQNGAGLSADLFYEMPYTFWNKPGRIRFDLKDLGFIQWNSNSMHYSADSSYHYEGIEVTDLFNLDSSASPLNIDEVIDENTSFKKQQYTTRIPGMLDIHTKFFYGKQIAFEKGITWRFNTSAKMYYYAKIHFLLGRSKSADIAYVIGYGGYGKFNSGIDLSADIGKFYSFQFMSYYLFSGVTAQSTTGMGAYIKLVRKF